MENLHQTINFSKKSDWFFLLKLTVYVFASFLIFYGISNILGGHRSSHFRIYFEWEINHIPLIPEFIFIYASSYLQIFAPAFFLTKGQLIKYVKGLIFVTIIAGICFNLFPSILGFSRSGPVERYQFLFNLLYFLDPPHNLFPSLHVAYTTMTSMTIRHFLQKNWQKGLLYIWQITLYLSVLFVHQHHLFDIATGLALAGVGIYLFGYHKIYPNIRA